jgi:multidrug efflux system outer membrane protein
VEQALLAETYLAAREAALQEAANIANEAAEHSNEEYSSGIGDVLTVIEATKRKIDSASQLAAIRHLRLENRVNLHLALGGDFRAAR